MPALFAVLLFGSISCVPYNLRISCSISDDTWDSEGISYTKLILDSAKTHLWIAYSIKVNSPRLRRTLLLAEKSGNRTLKNTYGIWVAMLCSLPLWVLSDSSGRTLGKLTSGVRQDTPFSALRSRTPSGSLVLLPLLPCKNSTLKESSEGQKLHYYVMFRGKTYSFLGIINKASRNFGPDGKREYSFILLSCFRRLVSQSRSGRIWPPTSDLRSQTAVSSIQLCAGYTHARVKPPRNTYYILS